MTTRETDAARPALRVLAATEAAAPPVDADATLIERRVDLAQRYYDRAWGDFAHLLERGGTNMPGLVQAAGVLADAIAIREDARRAMAALDADADGSSPCP